MPLAGKMKGSGGGKKTAQEVLITIIMVNFSLISGYGTYVIHLDRRFFLQYVVNLSKIMTSADEVMQISVKRQKP
jgi:hypothetical protein